ncbi:MAG: NADP-dependent oxidoreductase [Paracoccus sp. (in: a-proteobacteria)]|uniref:NADP-dependent oxidoreductase n=1 Tax=Paracoccus sp. TaxID=267 RepID=UPI0026DF29AA|nr:NADP-dependent oxidoreductase [Paracoccus sp. (in: a-proteobacteria)]MDO5632867.1 NADP-dependent oxidoreductase [Paracoccus sp. (in: a-proteobacteria)]
MTKDMMRACMMTTYGGPDAAALRDVPRPVAGPGQVLVRVRAAGLNPVDFKIRQGMLKVIQKYPMPAVMGNELAGEVVDCGPGVTGFARGDRVFARTPKDAMGAFAEYAALPVEVLAPMPASVDFVTAAGVPLAGLTAVQALRDELALRAGGRVFISGGAGGVGSFAIPLAKWMGAWVATTASPRGRALVERLGADQIIDYTSENFSDLLGDLDAAFDLIGGDTLMQTFSIMRPGGTVVSIAGMPEPVTARKDLGRGPVMAALFWLVSRKIRAGAARAGVRYRYLFMHPSGPDLALLAGLIDDGVLHPVIDRVFPFDQIADAMAYLETGRAKGKVVVQMPG